MRIARALRAPCGKRSARRLTPSSALADHVSRAEKPREARARGRSRREARARSSRSHGARSRHEGHPDEEHSTARCRARDQLVCAPRFSQRTGGESGEDRARRSRCLNSTTNITLPRYLPRLDRDQSRSRISPRRKARRIFRQRTETKMLLVRLSVRGIQSLGTGGDVHDHGDGEES